MNAQLIEQIFPLKCIKAGPHRGGTGSVSSGRTTKGCTKRQKNLFKKGQNICFNPFFRKGANGRSCLFRPGRRLGSVRHCIKETVSL